jgi:hypothetical protein
VKTAPFSNSDKDRAPVCRLRFFGTFQTSHGHPGARAHTLKEFTGLLAALPADRLTGHLHRHDCSRWIDDVFRDRPLAAHLRVVEAGAEKDSPRDVADVIAQAIRARYETSIQEAI